MTSFPGGLDAFTNPTPTQRMNRDPKHAFLHGLLADAIEALQAKVGTTNSAVTTSLDSRVQSNEAMQTRFLKGWPTAARENLNGSATLTSGTLRLAYFTAHKAGPSTGIRVISAVAAAATPTIVRFGLYTVDASGNVTLVASTPNDTTLLSVANTTYTKAWSVNPTMVKGQRYAFGALVVTAAAAPTIISVFTPSNTEAFIDPTVCSFLGGQADLPASVAVGSLGVTTNWIYGVATEA